MSKFRVVIRFSVDKENNSSLRNKLVAVFRKYNVTLQRATGTYENLTNRVTEADVSNMLEEFWATADAHEAPGKVDHFWMYADRKGQRAKRVVKKTAVKAAAKKRTS